MKEHRQHPGQNTEPTTVSTCDNVKLHQYAQLISIFHDLIEMQEFLDFVIECANFEASKLLPNNRTVLCITLYDKLLLN